MRIGISVWYCWVLIAETIDFVSLRSFKRVHVLDFFYSVEVKKQVYDAKIFYGQDDSVF